jgi:antitoxin CptB
LSYVGANDSANRALNAVRSRARRNALARVADEEPARYTLGSKPDPFRTVIVAHDPKTETAGLDVRRRKLVFRCWRHGTREMDLLLGRFVDDLIVDLSENDVGALEYLLEAPPQELFGWITGGTQVPANYDIPLLHTIRAYHRDNPVAGAD